MFAALLRELNRRRVRAQRSGLRVYDSVVLRTLQLFFRDLVTVVGLGVEGTTRGRAPNLLRSLAEKRFLPLGYYGRMIYSSCIHIQYVCI